MGFKYYNGDEILENDNEHLISQYNICYFVNDSKVSILNKDTLVDYKNAKIVTVTEFLEENLDNH